MKNLRTLPLVATLFFSASAFAAVKNITANIDPTIDIRLADNSELPSAIAMDYDFLKGLKPYTLNTQIFSNDMTKGVEMKLRSNAVLIDSSGSGKSIPLSVKFNGIELTTVTQNFPAATLYSNAASNTLPLVISQTTEGQASAAGAYSGFVSLMLTQSTK